ncbi:MAG TPA: hypothetical protein VGQ83_18770 [Polyangia bacterium]|jgi:hypothetical protein
MSVLHDLCRLAGGVTSARGAFSGEAAAHAHLAAATGAVPGGATRYLALPPERLEAVFPAAGATAPGVETDRDPVAELVGGHLDLFATTARLADGSEIPALSREAVVAELLARGGLALALVGLLLRHQGDRPLDVDEVREILKAARQGEAFPPLAELIDAA